jgi:isoquinoline 1-oxidoreductase alpha subunit
LVFLLAGVPNQLEHPKASPLPSWTLFKNLLSVFLGNFVSKRTPLILSVACAQDCAGYNRCWISLLIHVGLEVTMVAFQVNGTATEFIGDEQTPLLWVLRDHLKLKGSKFGCGIGQCGACSVHIDGTVQRSCVTPVSAIAGKSITTIEGLAPSENTLHVVQQAWLEEDVPQCGYCQAGQIMAAADLLARIAKPTDAEIDQSMTNICRCGTYVRIRKAVHRAVELKAGGAV